jgi:hypothetical protein
MPDARRQHLKTLKDSETGLHFVGKAAQAQFDFQLPLLAQGWLEDVPTPGPTADADPVRVLLSHLRLV